MSARTPAEAVERFLLPHRRALKCLTDSVLTIRGGFNPKLDVNGAWINKGLPARLYANEFRSLVASLHYAHYQVGGAWRVRIAGYNYELLGRDEAQVVSYHWHPGSRMKEPHLHLGMGLLPAGSPMAKAHFPTGFVSLPAFIRSCIDEWQIHENREDWRDVVDACDDELADCW